MTDRALSLLIVEDEAPIREGLIELFSGQGYDVAWEQDGARALETLAAGAFDIVLLDIMLPGLSGLEILAHVRAHGDQVPILLLTARGAEADIVAGLEAGADDYVTKPFGVHELLARVRGLCRRREHKGDSALAFASGPLTFDLEDLVVARGGERVSLSAREARLIEFLVAHRHRAVSREELLVEVWGYRDGGVQTRTVDVHIAGLRGKLRVLEGAEAAVETVRGRGYRFGLAIS